MRKQNTRITVVVPLMVFAVVVMTAASADSNHARQAAKSEFNAASPSATPPAKDKTTGTNKSDAGRRTAPSATQPAKKQADKIVATCNTAKGCEALRDACKSLKKHSFKATNADGSLGMCIDQSQATATFFLRNSNATNQPPKNPAADVGLAAPKQTSEATLYCHGAALCMKVKKICADLGGTYTGFDLSGSCEY